MSELLLLPVIVGVLVGSVNGKNVSFAEYLGRESVVRMVSIAARVSLREDSGVGDTHHLNLSATESISDDNPQPTPWKLYKGRDNQTSDVEMNKVCITINGYQVLV